MWQPAVYWLWGTTNTEKTRLAQAVCATDCYMTSACSFDSYTGQNVVVLDNLRPSQLSKTYLLDFLSRDMSSIHCRSPPLLAKVIIITSSKPHTQVWEDMQGSEKCEMADLTRVIKEEFHMAADDEAKHALLYRIRCDLARLKDPANWDDNEFYVSWDGQGTPPLPASHDVAASNVS